MTSPVGDEVREAVYAWIRDDLDVGAQMIIGFHAPKLIKRLAALQQPSGGWRAIETAPKDGTPIIGWHSNWDFGQVLCWEKPAHGLDDGSHSGCPDAWVYADWLQHNEDYAGVEPTHWQPLPAPPTHPTEEES